MAFDQDRSCACSGAFAGVVEEVVPELGDYVRKGETLAVIRSGEAAEAEKQYVDAVQGLAVAERNQRTVEEMYASGLASEKDRLEARQRYNTAQAELSRAKEFRTLQSCGGGELPTCGSCLRVCCRTQHQPQYAGTG
ncbi:MAG: efflux RND transporter periplasmic adaptor subunit [Alistipes indistinctus]